MNEPKIISRTETPCVFIEIKITLKQWGKANALFPELFEWIAKNGGEIGGPPFYQYYFVGDIDTEFQLKAGVVTTELMEGDKRVKSGLIEEGKYVSFIHKGHPDQLEKSHTLIKNWAKDKGINFKKFQNDKRELWAGLYEFYLTNPADESNPNNWQIEILYLVD